MRHGNGIDTDACFGTAGFGLGWLAWQWGYIGVVFDSPLYLSKAAFESYPTLYWTYWGVDDVTAKVYWQDSCENGAFHCRRRAVKTH